MSVLKPRMLSGHLQGRILSMFSSMIQPDRILEIGTYTGYSALCLAEGLGEGGMVTTIDINEELEERVQGYFEQSCYSKQIKYLIGDALVIVPTLKEKYDLVFVDADKINYKNYYDLIIDKMVQGGFIIVDNILWSGKVTKNIKKGDKDTKALIDFNKYVHEDTRVENVLLPVRDGLMLLKVL